MVHNRRRLALILLPLCILLIAGLLVVLHPWNRQQGPQRAQAPIAAGPPEVLLLSPSQAPELWRVTVDGQTRVQLTSTGGKLEDYASLPDGSRVAYSVKNAQGGVDLWEVSIQGGKHRQLLPCATDWCSAPVYAPDGSRLVYTRRQASGLGGEPSAPRLWTLDLSSLSTDSLVSDASVSGSRPAWSPDGRYLAFLDEPANSIYVLDLPGKQDFQLPAGAGSTLAWSPDSRRLLYTRPESSEEQPYVNVYEVDVQTRQALPLLGSDENGLMDYSLPDLTPDGAWMAVARRPMGGNTSKQLWLMKADGSQPRLIIDDALSNYAGYHWDSSGNLLVFQRFLLGSSSSRPEIAIWNRQNSQVTVLSKDAFSPHWSH